MWGDIVNKQNPLKETKQFKPEQNTQDFVPQTKNYDISEIIGITDFSSKKIMELLEYEYVITNQLRNQFKQVVESFDKIILNKKLGWIKNVSAYLYEKQTSINIKNAPIYQNKITKNSIIKRSSYKFCPKGFECEIYSNPKYQCKCHHFVHELIYNDIDSLLLYINQTDENINLEEITRCICTISFVVSHMFEEYKNIRYMDK